MSTPREVEVLRFELYRHPLAWARTPVVEPHAVTALGMATGFQGTGPSWHVDGITFDPPLDELNIQNKAHKERWASLLPQLTKAIMEATGKRPRALTHDKVA